MSAHVDAERAEGRREEAIKRGRETARKLTRLVELVAEGRSDTEISAALSSDDSKGWSPRMVRYWRQALKLKLGVRCGGRWYARRAT